MSVYVDEITVYNESQIKPAARRWGKRWSHLTADTDEELHQFAERLGLKRSYFQNAKRQCFRHYDLIPSVRTRAVRLGAVQVLGGEHFPRRLRAELAGEAARQGYDGQRVSCVEVTDDPYVKAPYTLYRFGDSPRHAASFRRVLEGGAVVYDLAMTTGQIATGLLLAEADALARLHVRTGVVEL